MAKQAMGACQVCCESFSAEECEADKHVFRTVHGRLLVLCPCCLEVARFDRHARQMLPSPTNIWGYE
jgi:hypothetical protein